MYSYSIYEALQNIEHEATGVFKDRPEGAGPEYGFWLLCGYVVEDNQLALRVSVTPQVLENGSNIEPVSLRAYFRNLDELNDDFQAVIKQLRTAAEPSSADLRQYEELCLKQGFNKFVARSACETARQGFLFVAEELEKAAPDAKSSVNS